MTRKEYRYKDKEVFGATKTLLLIDKDGNIIRQAQIKRYQYLLQVKEKWKKLYGNSKSYQEATYQLIENNNL